MILKKLASIGLIFMSVFVVGCSPENTEPVGDENVTITEETTEQITKEDMELALIDNEIIKMIITSKFEDEMGGITGYNVEIENKSDKNIMVATDSISCDGVMQDDNSMFVWNIQPHKKVIGEGYFFIGNNGIEGIENLKNIEVDFSISDNETYDTLLEFNVKID